MDKFYMIYVDGADSPTFKHETHKDAVDEAKRLCLQMEKRTYILEVKQAYDPITKAVVIKPE